MSSNWLAKFKKWSTPRPGSPIRRNPSRMRLILELLEDRLAPAAAGGAGAIVFFEPSVADWQVLRQGLSAGTDAVLLDAGGDGLRDMAAALAGRHDLAAIGIVTHGGPGSLSLGTTTLDDVSLGAYRAELATIGSALGVGGELDLWSCDVAAGPAGATFVGDLAAATGASVAAAHHAVGSAALGGDWLLNVRSAGARAAVPFGADARDAFHDLLGTWSSAASMATARYLQTATLLANGKALVTGGTNNGTTALSSVALYDPLGDTWSPAASMATARVNHRATLLGNGKVLITGGPTPTAAGCPAPSCTTPLPTRGLRLHPWPQDAGPAQRCG